MRAVVAALVLNLLWVSFAHAYTESLRRRATEESYNYDERLGSLFRDVWLAGIDHASIYTTRPKHFGALHALHSRNARLIHNYDGLPCDRCACVYDPYTGMFLQRDPMGYEDSVNLYAGLGWDPVNKRDPTGLISVVDALAAKDASTREKTDQRKKRKKRRTKKRRSLVDAVKGRHGQNARIYGIGVEPAETKGDTVEADEDPGHTIFYTVDAEKEKANVASFGPAVSVERNIWGFTHGGVEGRLDYPLVEGEKLFLYEYPITEQQLNKANTNIELLRRSPGRYTPERQCTSVAIECGVDIGLDLPSGEGPVEARVFGAAVYEGTTPNPHALMKQLREKGTPETEAESEDFKEFLPIKKK